MCFKDFSIILVPPEQHDKGKATLTQLANPG